jgi:hypothetical protein
MDLNERPHKGPRRDRDRPDLEQIRTSAKGKRRQPTKAALKRLKAKLERLRAGGSVKGLRRLGTTKAP